MAEKRCSIALSDVQNVIFECIKCGATLGYPISKWGRVPNKCRNCQVLPMNDNTQQELLERFKDAIRGIVDLQGTLPFRIRFELKEKS